MGRLGTEDHCGKQQNLIARVVNKNMLIDKGNCDVTSVVLSIPCGVLYGFFVFS